MNLKYLYVGLGVLGVLIIIVLALILIFDKGTPVKNNDLSVNDQNIVAISKTYFELYNSSADSDFSNFYALGDYSTAKKQTELLSYREDLTQTTAEGFLSIATADETKTHIKYLSAYTAEVTVSGSISKKSSLSSETKIINAQQTFELFKESGYWIVNRTDPLIILK